MAQDLFKIVGRQVGGPPKSEEGHFATCPLCGQAFDKRNLGEVLHHHQPQHEPLPRQ